MGLRSQASSVATLTSFLTVAVGPSGSRRPQRQPILVGDSPSSLQYLTRQAEPRANRHSDHEQNSTQAIRYMERLLTADELAERLGMKTG